MASQIDRSQSTLIPPSEDIARFDISETLSWVLVVEKEVRCDVPSQVLFSLTGDLQAIFQTLCHLGLSENPSLPGTGLIITVSTVPLPRQACLT